MLFTGDFVGTPAFGALPGTVRTKNKRLEIRGAKDTIERLLVRHATVTLVVC